MSVLSNIKVTQEQINELWNNGTLHTTRIFGKCIVVSLQLENGFIITESSACVDPANYDETIGFDICKERIMNQLWFLEGYALQKKVYADGK